MRKQSVSVSITRVTTNADDEPPEYIAIQVVIPATATEKRRKIEVRLTPEQLGLVITGRGDVQGVLVSPESK